MVWQILISVSLAPGSSLPFSSASKVVVARRLAPMMPAFILFVSKPSCITVIHPLWGGQFLVFDGNSRPNERALSLRRGSHLRLGLCAKRVSTISSQLRRGEPILECAMRFWSSTVKRITSALKSCSAAHRSNRGESLCRLGSILGRHRRSGVQRVSLQGRTRSWRCRQERPVLPGRL
jgi:hypothetical protein